MILFNSIWKGLFANLKRLGGGEAKWPPGNFAISNQMMMELGTVYGMTSLSCFVIL